MLRYLDGYREYSLWTLLDLHKSTPIPLIPFNILPTTHFKSFCTTKKKMQGVVIILAGFMGAVLIIFCAVCCHHIRKAARIDNMDPCSSLLMSASSNNYRSVSPPDSNTSSVSVSCGTSGTAITASTDKRSIGSPAVPMQTVIGIDEMSMAGNRNELYTPGAITKIHSIKLPTSIFPEYHNKRYHRRRKRKLLPQYTMEEVSRHNLESSCWIVVDDLVLDVTNFLQYHPAGRLSILNVGGTRCDFHFDFHSNIAQQLFWKFVIGRVERPKESCIIM